MTAKRKIQILIDILMTVMLPFLMAYQLIGEAIHEWIGMCLLFLCHHILNWHWHKNILKGRYNLFRIVETTVDILLFIIMAVLMISGIMMSKHIYCKTQDYLKNYYFSCMFLWNICFYKTAVRRL